MSLVHKLRYRLTDPVFYRKRWAQVTKSMPARDRRPMELSDLPDGKILLAIAHPDDESFCSGLLAELSCEREISVFCTTRGEGGGTGGTVDRAELGRTRESELRAALQVFGIEDVYFGDYVDPVGTDYRVYAPQIPTGELARKLADFHPSLIITHGSGGEYWHPAHLQLHDAALSLSVPTLTFNSWNTTHRIPRILNRHDPADLVFDASRHRTKRLAAIAEHRTQAHYFEEIVGGLEDFVDATAVECYTNW